MNLEEIQEIRKRVKYFIDCEASGLNQESYPIEIGISSVVNGHQFSTLIKPFESWTYWSYDAQDMHHIEREELQNGLNGIILANKMNHLYKDKTLWADSNFDKLWVETLFDVANVEMKFHVANLYNISLPDAYKRAFNTLIGNDIKHRALDDARQIENAWNQLINIIEEDVF